MAEVGVLAVAVGADNLRAGVVLGLAGVSGRRRMWFALAFGLAECVLPLLGLAVGAAALAAADVGQLAAPTAMAVCALLVLLEAVHGRRARVEPVKPLGDRSWALVVLPLALGLDNFAAGVALAALDVPVLAAVAVIGSVGAILAAAGLWLGHAIRLWLPSRVLAGLALLVMAAAEAARW